MATSPKESPHSASTSPSMSPAPPNQLKRKERQDEPDLKPTISKDGNNSLPTGAAHARPDEYEAGRVICEGCGAGVSFRDEETGGFTVNHWEEHRLNCPAAPHPSSNTEPMMYAAENESIAQPPSKRRRAKRTEDERIEYLRADPYVAQFEAYRVLCASCDKWIRLRPNSTYCSIPWDAHRKSCLAKKINNKNVYALEERNSMFSKDPDVRKFDPERVLCNLCDKWVAVPPDDHLQALQKWMSHREACQRNSGGSSSGIPHHHHAHVDAAHHHQQHPPAHSESNASRSPSQTHQPRPQQHRGSVSQSTSPTSPKAPQLTAQGPPHSTPSSSRYPPPAGHNSPSFHDLTPSTYAPAHESRRRNAEQRAATLRADRLIGEVEANRVFCSLCKKWVQLRQDSSFCAYPWLQHRGKCLARHQRRLQKSSDMSDIKGGRRVQNGPVNGRPGGSGVMNAEEEDELMSDMEDAPGEPEGSDVDIESEDGADGSELTRRPEPNIPNTARHVHPGERRPTITEGHRPSSSSRSHRHQYPQPHSLHHPHAPQYHQKSRSLPYPSSSQHRYGGSMSQAILTSYRNVHHARPHSSGHRTSHTHPQHSQGQNRQHVQYSVDEDVDADGEPDGEGEYMDENSTPPPPAPRPGSSSSRNGPNGASMSRGIPNQPQILRRPYPVGLADLDSPTGRKQFIFGSVEYLFATTYESTDDMSISALVAYLNAAIPQDKHEDFDTAEVVRAVASLKEKGKIAFEGDMLRLID